MQKTESPKARAARLLAAIREDAAAQGEMLAAVIDTPEKFARGPEDSDTVSAATARTVGVLIALRSVARHNDGRVSVEMVQAAIDAFCEGARVDVRPSPMGGELFYRLPGAGPAAVLPTAARSTGTTPGRPARGVRAK